MDFTELSNKELSEAIDFHRRQRNMSRGVNESAHMRQTQVVRLLEAEEARRLNENIGGLFKDSSEWERSAKDRGLVVKPATHPSGEMTKYQIAKDKQGNNRGHFDHGTKSGRLTEEVELDELDKKTLGSYVRKSAIDAYRRGQDVEYHTGARDKTDNFGTKMRHAELTDKARLKASNRIAGIEKATHKMAKEEVELDEGHYHVSWSPNLSHTVMNAKSADHAVASAKAHLIKKIPKLADEKYSDTFEKKPRVTNITNESVMSFSGFRSKDSE